MPRRLLGPFRRNPDLPQPEFCDVCGNLRARTDLVELQVEGLRGKVGCDLCLQGGLKSASFRDNLARQGRRPSHMPHRMPPYGASGTWWDVE